MIRVRSILNNIYHAQGCIWWTFNVMQLKRQLLFVISVPAEWSHTVLCRYNAVKFLPNSPKIHPLARPLGRGMGCILWVRTVIFTLPQSLQWLVQYHVILDHVITALGCIWPFEWFSLPPSRFRPPHVLFSNKVICVWFCQKTGQRNHVHIIMDENCLGLIWRFPEWKFDREITIILRPMLIVKIGFLSHLMTAQRYHLPGAPFTYMELRHTCMDKETQA